MSSTLYDLPCFSQVVPVDHTIVLARLTRIPVADPPSHDIASPFNVYVCVPPEAESHTQFILSDDVADAVQSIFVFVDDRFHSPTYGLGSTRNQKHFTFLQLHIHITIHYLYQAFFEELTNKLKYIPAVGQAPLLQTCSSTFSVPTQAVPPFSSFLRVVLNLYCFPPPHVVVHPV